MRRVVRYGAAGLALLGVLVAGLWAWLDEAGRRGIVAAAAVAWPIQVVAFGLLVQSRDEQTKFLAVWVGGTLVRMAVIGVAAFALTQVSGLAPAPTLLGLAGFFFGLLLLEPVFFRRSGPAGTMDREASDDEDSRDDDMNPEGGGSPHRESAGETTTEA